MRNSAFDHVMPLRAVSVAGMAILLIFGTTALSAQQISRTRVGLVIPEADRDRGEAPLLRLPAARETASYWKEGGVVTSLITIVAANIWVRDVSARQRVFGSVALGGVFFVPGALIGGQFRKK